MTLFYFLCTESEKIEKCQITLSSKILSWSNSAFTGYSLKTQTDRSQAGGVIEFAGRGWEGQREVCSLGQRLHNAHCILITFPAHTPSPGQSHGLARDISGILQLEVGFLFFLTLVQMTAILALNGSLLLAGKGICLLLSRVLCGCCLHRVPIPLLSHNSTVAMPFPATVSGPALMLGRLTSAFCNEPHLSSVPSIPCFLTTFLFLFGLETFIVPFLLLSLGHFPLMNISQLPLEMAELIKALEKVHLLGERHFSTAGFSKSCGVLERF